MQKFKCLSKLFQIIILLLICSGCATILGGRNNTFHFNDESLTEAEVYMDGEKIGDAPGKIKVPKGQIQHGSKIEIQADGFHTQEYVILRKQHAAYTIASLLTGGIPLIVDFSTGDIYRPRPHKFEYVLQKHNEPR